MATRLTLGKIKAAVLKELAMVCETAHVAGLRQDGQRDDWSDARKSL